MSPSDVMIVSKVRVERTGSLQDVESLAFQPQRPVPHDVAGRWRLAGRAFPRVEGAVPSSHSLADILRFGKQTM